MASGVLVHFSNPRAYNSTMSNTMMSKRPLNGTSGGRAKRTCRREHNYAVLNNKGKVTPPPDSPLGADDMLEAHDAFEAAGYDMNKAATHPALEADTAASLGGTTDAVLGDTTDAVLGATTDVALGGKMTAPLGAALGAAVGGAVGGDVMADATEVAEALMQQGAKMGYNADMPPGAGGNPDGYEDSSDSEADDEVYDYGEATDADDDGEATEADEEDADDDDAEEADDTNGQLGAVESESAPAAAPEPKLGVPRKAYPIGMKCAPRVAVKAPRKAPRVAAKAPRYPVKAPPAKKKKKRRAHWSKKIQKAQSSASCRFAMAKANFQRFVRYVMQQEDVELRVQGSAMFALQEAVETEMIEWFENNRELATHRKVVTIDVKDIVRQKRLFNKHERLRNEAHTLAETAVATEAPPAPASDASGQRRVKVLRDPMMNVKVSAICRLAHRAGVRRISKTVFGPTRQVMYDYIAKVVRDAVCLTRLGRRKTVVTSDILYSLKRQGATVYGLGAHGRTVLMYVSTYPWCRIHNLKKYGRPVLPRRPSLLVVGA